MTPDTVFRIGSKSARPSRRSRQLQIVEQGGLQGLDEPRAQHRYLASASPQVCWKGLTPGAEPRLVVRADRSRSSIC